MSTGKIRQVKPRSRFANALKQLLDDAGFYTRKEWAAFLGITPPALSQWVNDTTLPRSDLLRLILDLLRLRGGEKAAPFLRGFDKIAKLDAREISPLGARMIPNVEAYLEKSLLSAVRDGFRDLSEVQKIAALSKGSWDPMPEPKDSAPQTKSAGFDLLAADSFGPRPKLVSVDDRPGGGAAVDWEAIIDRPRILVVGTPGSGKSSSLRALMRTLEQLGQVGVLADARSLPAEGLQQWLDKHLGEPVPPVIVIDGLDEMAVDQRHAGIALIGEASLRAPGARFVVSSRPIAELQLLDRFERFSIAPLSDLDIIAALVSTNGKVEALDQIGRFFCHMFERDTLWEARRNRMFLKSTWTLFEQNAVTPFAETEVIGGYVRALLDCDHLKGLNRVREPWASSQQLFGLLGQLSFCTLRMDKESFDSKDISAWIGDRSYRIPVDRLVELLLVTGLIIEDSRGYAFSHRTLRDYFAAQYVIQGTADAEQYLHRWKNQQNIPEVLRYACGSSPDATSLFSSVMESSRNPATRYTVLSDILAQPIVVSSSVLEDACQKIGKWLDRMTAAWKIKPSSSLERGAPVQHWQLSVTGAEDTFEKPVEETLRALHRARSGPAFEPLKAALENARSSFLPAFAESLDVEGKLSFMHSRTTEALVVSVEEPHLS